MNREELLIKKQEDYIKIAKEKHKIKYDYSLVKYIGAKIKVKIICPEHGLFFQDLYKHSIMGYGCKKCSQKKISDKQRMGINEFLKKAKDIHGNKYDYSKMYYESNKKKIIIFCNTHKKEFLQSPEKHIYSKQGCRDCGIERRAEKKTKTNEQFILELKQIHGDKYDYSKVNYIGSHDKVTIICKEHGEFNMTPTHLLSGEECAKCQKVYRYSKEEFFEIANKKYDYKYEYYTDNYTKKRDRIKIKCKIHNIIFEQEATGHLLYEGCPECLDGKRKDIFFQKRNTKEDIIERFNSIHGNKYDYSLVDYNGLQEKIKIICKEHGIFEQTPTNHLKKKGCMKCSGYEKLTFEEIVSRSKKKFGDRFNYLPVEIESHKTMLNIYCKEHKIFFQQKAGNHLRGLGCPKCIPVGYSYKQIKWLEYISKTRDVNIQHKLNCGEKQIGKYRVDGYDYSLYLNDKSL